jgi:hypothetical protein
MPLSTQWPCVIAAICAFTTGVLLLLGGSGHLLAVLEVRSDQPFDFHFVSLLTTSGLLLFPGLVNLSVSYGIWRGQRWAFAASLLSTTALALYLALLHYMKSQVPEAAVGSELNYMTAFVAVSIAVVGSVLLTLRNTATAAATPSM